MSVIKNCGCQRVCGCGDVLAQGSACSGYPSCSDPQECPEVQDGKCLIYTGDEIVNIPVPNGARFNEIVQRMIGAIVSPGCNYSDSICLAVVFYSDYITPTTIRLKWGVPENNGAQFQVYYRKTTDTNWSLNTAVDLDVTTDTIAGLTPDTYYYIKIATLCEIVCYSVTLKIKTKPS